MADANDDRVFIDLTESDEDTSVNDVAESKESSAFNDSTSQATALTEFILSRKSHLRFVKKSSDLLFPACPSPISSSSSPTR